MRVEGRGAAVRPKRVVRVAAAVLVLGTVSACGGSSSAASSTTTSGAPGTSATATTTLPPGSVCSAAALAPEVTATDAGAGQRYLTIGLRNTSKERCSLSGFVDVAAYHGADVVVARSHHADVTTLMANLIDPGKLAYFDVHYTVVETGAEACPPVDRFVITVPDHGSTDLALGGQVPRLCPASGIEVSSLRTQAHL